jgi:hypothetical protein
VKREAHIIKQNLSIRHQPSIIIIIIIIIIINSSINSSNSSNSLKSVPSLELSLQ